MFSSNPFLQVPPSTYVSSPPTSFFDQEKHDFHFTNYQKIDNPLISGDFLFHAYNSPAPPPVTENAATIKQDMVLMLQQQFSQGSGFQDSEDHIHDDLLDSVIPDYKKKPATSQKDGHSKIYTAQGPRDRRVRLSIEIARKFFSLQDLLGFDKASKTLDWLFTKSLTAIKDLVEETNHCSSSTYSHLSNAKFLETIKGDSDEENSQKKRPILKFIDGKKKKTTLRSKAVSQENFARDQSRARAEARARARERTKEKLRVKNDLRTLVSDGCESGCWGQIELQSDYDDIRCQCLTYQETSKQTENSSFQIKNLALPKFKAVHEQQGIMQNFQ